MPKRTRPRRGSLQFWPRKRAARIYPRTRHWLDTKDIKPLGFAAWKAGMTHVEYVDTSKSPHQGRIVAKAVTVLDAPALLVCAARYYIKMPNGMQTAGELWSDKLPKDLDRKMRSGKPNANAPQQFDDVTFIVATQPRKSGMHKVKPDVFELGIGGSDAAKKSAYARSMLGKELHAKDLFKPGEYLDLSAVTKGHGFTGPVKRFGIRIQTRKDKQMHRHVGSLGTTTPRKVDWRVPQAGQHGFHTRTESGKRLLVIGDDPAQVNPSGGFLSYGVIPSSYLIVEGSFPGHRKRLIRLRKSIRATGFEPISVKSVSMGSAQGA